MSDFTLPVRESHQIVAACDLAPVQPEQRQQLYVRLAARQGGDRIDQVEKRIRAGGPFRRELVTGHAGSGKSTELLRLATELRTPKHERQFHVVYLDANVLLGMWNLRLPQILLAMMSALSAEPRVDLRDSPTARSFAAKVAAIISGVAGSVGKELAKKVDQFAGVSIVGAAIKASQELANEFRDRASAQMQDLLAAAAAVVEEVSNELQMEVVFIIDNLEKVPEQVIEGGRDLHDVLFAQELPLLDLQAHIVLTYPISLNYKSYDLGHRFSASRKTTLPMVSVREAPDETGRARGDDEQGIDLLVAALGRRIDLDLFFDEPETVRYLVRASGGCVRDVLRFAGALPIVSQPPFTATAVEAALADFRNDYERLIGGKAYVAALPTLAASGQFPPDFSMEAKREILLGLVALEYDTQTWFDVHPLVKRTRAYLHAERTWRG